MVKGSESKYGSRKPTLTGTAKVIVTKTSSWRSTQNLPGPKKNRPCRGQCEERIGEPKGVICNLSNSSAGGYHESIRGSRRCRSSLPMRAYRIIQISGDKMCDSKKKKQEKSDFILCEVLNRVINEKSSTSKLKDVPRCTQVSRETPKVLLGLRKRERGVSCRHVTRPGVRPRCDAKTRLHKCKININSEELLNKFDTVYEKETSEVDCHFSEPESVLRSENYDRSETSGASGWVTQSLRNIQDKYQKDTSQKNQWNFGSSAVENAQTSPKKGVADPFRCSCHNVSVCDYPAFLDCPPTPFCLKKSVPISVRLQRNKKSTTSMCQCSDLFIPCHTMKFCNKCRPYTEIEDRPSSPIPDRMLQRVYLEDAFETSSYEPVGYSGYDYVLSNYKTNSPKSVQRRQKYTGLDKQTSTSEYSQVTALEPKHAPVKEEIKESSSISPVFSHDVQVIPKSNILPPLDVITPETSELQELTNAENDNQLGSSLETLSRLLPTPLTGSNTNMSLLQDVNPLGAGSFYNESSSILTVNTSNHLSRDQLMRKETVSQSRPTHLAPRIDRAAQTSPIPTSSKKEKENIEPSDTGRTVSSKDASSNYQQETLIKYNTFENNYGHSKQRQNHFPADLPQKKTSGEDDGDGFIHFSADEHSEYLKNYVSLKSADTPRIHSPSFTSGSEDHKPDEGRSVRERRIYNPLKTGNDREWSYNDASRDKMGVNDQNTRNYTHEASMNSEGPFENRSILDEIEKFISLGSQRRRMSMRKSKRVCKKGSSSTLSALNDNAKKTQEYAENPQSRTEKQDIPPNHEKLFEDNGSSWETLKVILHGVRSDEKMLGSVSGRSDSSFSQSNSIKDAATTTGQGFDKNKEFHFENSNNNPSHLMLSGTALVHRMENVVTELNQNPTQSNVTSSSKLAGQSGEKYQEPLGSKYHNELSNEEPRNIPEFFDTSLRERLHQMRESSWIKLPTLSDKSMLMEEYKKYSLSSNSMHKGNNTMYDTRSMTQEQHSPPNTGKEELEHRSWTSPENSFESGLIYLIKEVINELFGKVQGNWPLMATPQPLTRIQEPPSTNKRMTGESHYNEIGVYHYPSPNIGGHASIPDQNERKSGELEVNSCNYQSGEGQMFKLPACHFSSLNKTYMTRSTQTDPLHPWFYSDDEYPFESEKSLSHQHTSKIINSVNDTAASSTRPLTGNFLHRTKPEGPRPLEVHSSKVVNRENEFTDGHIENPPFGNSTSIPPNVFTSQTLKSGAASSSKNSPKNAFYTSDNREYQLKSSEEKLKTYWLDNSIKPTSEAPLSGEIWHTPPLITAAATNFPADPFDKSNHPFLEEAELTEAGPSSSSERMSSTTSVPDNENVFPIKRDKPEVQNTSLRKGRLKQRKRLCSTKLDDFKEKNENPGPSHNGGHAMDKKCCCCTVRSMNQRCNQDLKKRNFVYKIRFKNKPENNENNC